MAENLDDFFAKKDKKKTKATKPKFITAEELVKNLEDTSKREAATKPKPTAVVEEPIAEIVTVEEPTEEEWKEFVEEERRKDYSGLKIGQLTMNDDDDSPTGGEGDEDDFDSDGNLNVDVGKRSGGDGGPWKKVIPAEEVTQIPMEMGMEKEKSSSKIYISPALRHSQQALPPGSASRLKLRNRAAPDITNADYFPTLGAARPEEQRKKKNEPAFEEVRHGGRIQRIQEQPSQQASTVTNRFQSLDEDDS